MRNRPSQAAKGNGAGQLDSPRGLAVAPNGDLLTADLVNGRIARFGGEEFVVILSQTGSAKGMQIAERIRKRIAHRCSMDAATTGKITVSIGAGEIRDAETVDGLFDRADRALYRAKSEGRNRCVAAD